MGGSGTGQTITIEADGRTTIKLHGTQNTEVKYSGQFSNPIIYDSGDGVRLEGNIIYSLKTDGEVAIGCRIVDVPCQSELEELP